MAVLDELGRDAVFVVFALNDPATASQVVTSPDRESRAWFHESIEEKIVRVASSSVEIIDLLIGEGRPATSLLAESDDVTGRDLCLHVVESVPEVL